MATEKWRKENRDRQQKYQRDWYSRNKVKQKNIVRSRKKEITDWYKDYKSTLKCSNCSETHPATLDFHHKEESEKESDIGSSIHNGWSKLRIEEEISKCIVLCANCHRKLHWNKKYDFVVKTDIIGIS